MDEFSIFNLEKLVKVESIFYRFTVKFHLLRKFIMDNLRHLIGIEIERREHRIRVLYFVGIIPITLTFLLVGVSVVEYGVVVELIVCKSLEWSSRKMQREIALDAIERHVGLVGINTFMGFVDNKQIPVGIFNFLKFIKLATKIDGTFQVLKRCKVDKTEYRQFLLFARYLVFCKFVIRDDVLLVLDTVNIAYEEIL